MTKLNVDMNVDYVQSLLNDFDESADMFNEFKTPYLQMKYFKNNGCFTLNQKVIPLALG